MSSEQRDQEIVITPIPAQRLGWVRRELEQAGAGHYVERTSAGYNVHTYTNGAPIAQRVAGYTPQSSDGGGWDLMRRQRANRSRTTDALGFVFSLGLVGAVLYAAGAMADVLSSAGIDPDAAQALIVPALGMAVTLVVSELVIGASDNRRWMFIAGMGGLFLAAAMWFGGNAAGLPMQAALDGLIGR